VQSSSPKPTVFSAPLRHIGVLLLPFLLAYTMQVEAKTSSTSTQTTTKHRHTSTAISTPPTQAPHGKRHHSASQQQATSHVATTATLRRRRGRHQATVVQTSSKNSSHQKLTRRSHERTIEHKNSDEEVHQVSQVDKEPPSVRVDFEGLNRAYSLYDAGVNHRLAGNFPLALSELREAQQIFHLHSQQQSPMETYAYFELAKTAEEAGSYDLAVHSYLACSDLDPKFTEARLHLARLEAKHGNLQAALREAKAAYSQDPTSAEAHLIVSLLMVKSGLRPEPQVEKPPRTDLDLGKETDKELNKDNELIRKIPDVDETQPATMDPKEP
jgi:hypothetical protein